MDSTTTQISVAGVVIAETRRIDLFEQDDEELDETGDESIEEFTVTLLVTGSRLSRQALRDILEPVVQHCTAAEAIETGLEGAGGSGTIGLLLDPEPIICVACEEPIGRDREYMDYATGPEHIVC